MVSNSKSPAKSNSTSSLASRHSQALHEAQKATPNESGNSAFKFSGSAAAQGNPSYIIVEGDAVSYYWQQLYVDLWFHMATVMNLMWGCSPYYFIDAHDGQDQRPANQERNHVKETTPQKNRPTTSSNHLKHPYLDQRLRGEQKPSDAAAQWVAPNRFSKAAGCNLPAMIDTSTKHGYEVLAATDEQHTCQSNVALEHAGPVPCAPVESKQAPMDKDFNLELLEHEMICNVNNGTGELSVDWNDVHYTTINYPIDRNNAHRNTINYLMELRTVQLPRKRPYRFLLTAAECSDHEEMDTDAPSQISDAEHDNSATASILEQLWELNASIKKSPEAFKKDPG